MKNKSKHENYEALNLIGYGLAKFNNNFIRNFGCKAKTDFYQYIVKLGIAETVGTVKNRQDLFDPFFDNNRKGWWQKGDTYIHRKVFIDSLFGTLNSNDYTNIVKLYLKNINSILVDKIELSTSPLINSKFKQLQETGQKAERFFMENYKKIKFFKYGILEDARNFGDGYDFQIQVKNEYFLTEIKGVRMDRGSIRMTKNEFSKAKEYCNGYALVIISNLDGKPDMNIIFNPINMLNFSKKIIHSSQLNYHSENILWKKFH